MMTPSLAFRRYLQEELIRRCKDNPRYSLRAYALSLNMSHATLSHILRGKRALTPALIAHLGHELGLSEEELAPYQSQEDAEESVFEQLEIDLFEMVSDWQYDAILELTRIRGFQSDPKWVASALGITVSEVNIAIERLMRLGLLKTTPNGRWVETKGDLSALGENDTNVALQKLQIQLLEKAIRAVRDIPFKRRSNSSVAMAIHEGDLPAVRDEIKRFRRKLCKYLQRKNRSSNQVYQLMISFFPLSDV